MTAPGIELGRDFWVSSAEAEMPEMGPALAMARSAGRTLTWDTLLESSTVVVLGEMGSGKTIEFQRAARVLRDQGQFAIDVSFGELAADGLCESLPYPEQQALETWLNDEDNPPGHFFLDSLDEAKLEQFTLKRAIKKLGQALGPAADRARVFVSCRPSDWAPKSDESAFDVLPGNREPKVVQLAPLTDEQVRKLAGHRGVKNVDGFMEAVSAASAQSFVARPLDVEWLVDYWNSKGRIGSLSELVAYSIEVRLRDAPGRRTGLTPDRAREGVRDLAGLGALTASRMVALPGAPERPGLKPALDPRAAMPSWSDEDLSALLTLGLFDEATYGRVRLHHRSAQEYLAAEWLRELVRQGLSRRELERLLFCEHDSRLIVRPHLAPVAAWLALHDDSVRERMIRIAPHELIEHGDPNELPEADRRRLLESYAEQYDGRSQLFRHFDRVSLGRLAAPSLVPTVRDLLQKGPDELRATLIKMAKEGELVDLLPDVRDLALGLRTDSRVRMAAFRFLEALGTDAEKHAVAALPGSALHDHDVFGAFVQLVFPEHLSVADLLTHLQEHPPTRQNHYSFIDLVLTQELPELVDPTTRLELIDALLNSFSTTNDGSLNWLVPLLAALTARAIDELAGEPEEPLAKAMRYFEERRGGTHRRFASLEKVRTAIANSSLMRRAVYWENVERAFADGAYPRRYWDIRDSHSLYELGDADVAWLAEDALNRDDVRERLLAFDTLARIRVSVEAESTRQEGLETLARGSEELGRRLERMRNPPPLPATSTRRWDLLHRAREQRFERANQAQLARLQAAGSQIANGTDIESLTVLLHAGSRGEPRYGDWDHGKVAEALTPELAEAASNGLRAFWKTVQPPRPESAEKANLTPRRMVLALAGLEVSAEAGELDSLDGRKAAVAAVVATWELNEFPTWLMKIAEAHPCEVAQALAPSVEYEAGRSPSEHDGGRVLAKLRRGDPALAQLMAPTLAALLEEIEPPCLDALSKVLDLLVAHHPATLGELATARAPAASVPERFGVWLAAWMRLDPKAALAFLQGPFRRLSLTARCDRIVAWAAHEEERASWAEDRKAAAWMAAGTLRVVIPILFEHVPPDEDVVHETMYSPSSRDEAGDFRERALRNLASVKGDDAAAVYRELAGEAPMAKYRDWLLRMAEDAAARNPSCGPLSKDQALEWAEGFVRAPSDPDELHEVALQRLDDIKLFIERGEQSYRSLLTQKDGPASEHQLQLWLADELKRRSCGHYTITREEEVDDRKKPDIRLHKTAFAGPCNLEVKVADNWTYKKLVAGLEEQLVGLYLRAEESQHGAYVLAWTGTQQRWKVPDGDWLGFAQVVEDLATRAKELEASEAGVSRLSVVGIDLTPPSDPDD